MTSMRERLISKVIASDGFTSVGAMPDTDAASKIVNAILAELREPDEAMIYDGVAVNDVLDPHDAPPSRYEVERAFTAMIDAIRTGDET